MTEAFSVTKENGKVIRGFIYKPQNIEGKLPTVILSHGYGSSCRFFFNHTEDILNAGFVAVFFDFVGGGKECYSDGTMAEMTVLTEVEDLKCVLKYTQSLDFVDSKNIFLWGESQGGVVSTLVASDLSDQIAGLTLWYPAYCIPDDCKRRNETGIHEVFEDVLPLAYDECGAKIDIYERISKVNSPVIIIHGDKDSVVNIDYSRKAMEYLPHGSLVVIPNADHGYNEVEGSYARTCSIAFMKFVIGRS